MAEVEGRTRAPEHALRHTAASAQGLLAWGVLGAFGLSGQVRTSTKNPLFTAIGSLETRTKDTMEALVMMGSGVRVPPSARERSLLIGSARQTRWAYSSRTRTLPRPVERANSKAVSKSPGPSSLGATCGDSTCSSRSRSAGCAVVVPATPVPMERGRSMSYRRLPAAQPEGAVGYAARGGVAVGGVTTAPSAPPTDPGTPGAAVSSRGTQRPASHPSPACPRSSAAPSGRGDTATP
jgi:hypothetical protein